MRLTAERNGAGMMTACVFNGGKVIVAAIHPTTWALNTISTPTTLLRTVGPLTLVLVGFGGGK